MTGAFYVSYIMLWVLLIVTGVLVVLLYRHFGLVAMGTLEGVQRDGLMLGEEAPPVMGVAGSGEEVAWRQAEGLPAFLLFASPSCEPCAAVIPYVEHLARSPKLSLDMAVVVDGRGEAAAEMAEKFQTTIPCFGEGASGAFSTYRVRVTPFAFVIGSDRRVLSKGLCNSAQRLRELLAAGGLPHAAELLDPMIRDAESDVPITHTRQEVST